MIAKLRATGGAGFDLAQPSHDRIHAAHLEYNIYKPMDLSQINTDAMEPGLLDGVNSNTTIDGNGILLRDYFSDFPDFSVKY